MAAAVAEDVQNPHARQVVELRLGVNVRAERVPRLVFVNHHFHLGQAAEVVLLRAALAAVDVEQFGQDAQYALSRFLKLTPSSTKIMSIAPARNTAWAC